MTDYFDEVLWINARIGTPRLNACTSCTTQSFSTSMSSAILAPCRNAALM